MKTSNKLLLMGLIVLLSALAAYNIALKAEYRTEAYRDPLRNHSALAFKGFEEVDVNAGNLLNVHIEAGDRHEVYLLDDSKEVVQISQDGKRLMLDVALTDEHNRVAGWRGPHVIIRTPYLKVLRTDAVHTLNGEPQTILHTQHQYYGVQVKGLRQDALQLQLDNGSYVKLSGNTLSHLQAVTGASSESQPLLQLMSDNKIDRAGLDIRSRSHLNLQDLTIPDLQFTFSENAKIELSGASLAIIRK